MRFSLQERNHFSVSLRDVIGALRTAVTERSTCTFTRQINRICAKCVTSPTLTPALFESIWRFMNRLHLHLTRRQRQVLVMNLQHPLVWCPPPLRPKATTICRLLQRCTVPTTTAVYRPISVNGMFKTVSSQEEPFQKTRRTMQLVQNERSYIMRLSNRI